MKGGRELDRRDFLRLSAATAVAAAVGSHGRALGAESTGPGGKKLIEYGWDVPTARFVRENIAVMERRPFDGVMFNLTEEWRHAFDTRRWAEEEMDFEVLRGIRWGRFTDNFLVLHAANHERAMDWFDDDHWATIAANMRLYARAAKAARCVGITFDTEPYGPSPWEYNPSLYPGKSFEEVEEKVRERGARFISALQGELPGLRLLCFYLLGLVRAQTEAEGGDISRTQYALLRAFADGWLDAVAKGTRIIDGNEGAYYHDETLKFFRGHEYIRGAAELVSAENRAKYRGKVQVGNALYLDYVFGAWPEFDRGWPESYKKLWWEHNVYHALATTDKYAWCYSEAGYGGDWPPDSMSWWTRPPRYVPPGTLAAMTSARNKLASGQVLGFDMIKKVGYWDETQRATIARSLKVRLTRPSEGAQFDAPANLSLIHI